MTRPSSHTTNPRSALLYQSAERLRHAADALALLSRVDIHRVNNHLAYCLGEATIIRKAIHNGLSPGAQAELRAVADRLDARAEYWSRVSPITDAHRVEQVAVLRMLATTVTDVLR